jgi:hypothetical protein
MADKLIQAIGVNNLTLYFEYLDDLRESGRTNMFGAYVYLMREFSMSKEEALKVTSSWQDTFSDVLPAEDRVDMAMGD